MFSRSNSISEVGSLLSVFPERENLVEESNCEPADSRAMHGTRNEIMLFSPFLKKICNFFYTNNMDIPHFFIDDCSYKRENVYEIKSFAAFGFDYIVALRTKCILFY